MPDMRSALAAAAQRRASHARSTSLSTVPPAESDEDYLPELAAVAASILYRSPLLSFEGRPIYILNAAAFPDAFEVDYDSLLAYVLARLPGEDELISGTEYEIVFFAGGASDSPTAEKKQGPNTGWYLQAYHVLGRATRKKLQRLYIVHPRTWVRVLISVFGTIVSPKFRRKIVHVNSLTQLALHLPIEKMLIPPSAYLHDRKISPDIYARFVTGRRAFGARHPLPKNISTGKKRLPRVLRETTSFILLPSNVQTEGLFRIPPHSMLLGILKEAYDRGQQFIVWKERDTSYLQPDFPKSLEHEIRLEDSYGVHFAASLIKTWYRELREPIFPEACYTSLRERYNDPNVQVTPEALHDLIYPGSNASPLTRTAREILTHHLLPLLSTVARYEPSNKMGPENLAICFSMCLMCGSNHMEDGRMSTIIRRILQPAIEFWPDLRKEMNIDAEAFMRDIAPPPPPRDYEDPLELANPSVAVSDSTNDDEHGHRITMNDTDNPNLASSEGTTIPALPPRRSRAASLKKALTPQLPNIDLPSLPKIDLPSLPKRKPAPHHSGPPSPNADLVSTADDSNVTAQPPRYSTVFDHGGKSIQDADSPTTVGPADGFALAKRADFSFPYGEEKISVVPPSDSCKVNPMIAVPKRKALSGSEKLSAEDVNAEPMPELPRKPSETNVMLARMAAQQAANNLAQRIAVIPPTETEQSTSASASGINSAPADLTKTPDALTPEGAVFRKPSWPASAARMQQTSQQQQPAKIQSFARPVYTQTVPIVGVTHDGLVNRSLQAPHVPKPRAPSPGLLKRMSSMETTTTSTVSGANSNAAASSAARLQPNRLNLRKTSVDDLRRLYEERSVTAQSLVEAGRRKSDNQ